MQLFQAGDGCLDRRVCRKVEDHRLDLGAQEVVGAARAEFGQARGIRGLEEVEDLGRVGEVADHGLVVRGDAADRGGKCGGLRAAGVGVERAETFACGAEGEGLAVLSDVGGGGLDDPERVGFGCFRRVAPGGDAVAAEDATDCLGVLLLDRGDVESELEAGAAPRDPDDLVAEDLGGQRLAIDGGRDCDARIRMQVVNVCGIDEAVHGGVDRRCCAALAVQAVVEGGDHFVFAVDAGVDAHERAHAVHAQDCEARLLQGAEVATRALDPHQLDGLAGDRVVDGALGRRVATGVVGVSRVGTQAVAAGDEIGCCGGR